MVDIAKHPILKQCYEVLDAIEDCGASEKLTEASIKASDLLSSLDALITNKSIEPKLISTLAIINNQ